MKGPGWLRSLRLIGLGSAIACTLVSAPALASPDSRSVSFARQSIPRAEFGLKVGNENFILVSGAGHQVTLTVLQGLSSVSYTVRGQVSPQGIKARIGNLGLIAVQFRASGKIKHENPPDGCRGKPITVRPGAFIGRIRFWGEHGYMDLNARRARGSVNQMPQSLRWNCKALHPDGESLPPEAKKPVSGLSVLTASTQGKSLLFVALGLPVDEKDGLGLVLFMASTTERRGSIRIDRSVVAFGDSTMLRFDEGNNSAMVTPPPPFHGTGIFERNPGGSPSWTGALGVHLPGADIGLTGPRIAARLAMPESFAKALEVLLGNERPR